MIRFGHVNLKKRRPQTFTLKWSTCLCPTWFCVKHSLHNRYPTLCLDPSVFTCYSPRAFFSCWSSLPAHPTMQHAREKENKIFQKFFQPMTAGHGKETPQLLYLRRVLQSRLLFTASRVPHWHQDPMVPGVTGLTICFSTIYPLLPPLATFQLLFVSVQLFFLMFLSGICFSGSSNPGKNQRKSGGCKNSVHKSQHPTSGPHPIF